MITLIRWVVGYGLFLALSVGVLYGLTADKAPWWSWACIGFVVIYVICLIPGRIRNGYWGASPSTSAWEQIKAEERLRRKPPSN
jgi:hypothetical protein